MHKYSAVMELGIRTQKTPQRYLYNYIMCTYTLIIKLLHVLLMLHRVTSALGGMGLHGVCLLGQAQTVPVMNNVACLPFPAEVSFGVGLVVGVAMCLFVTFSVMMLFLLYFCRCVCQLQHILHTHMQSKCHHLVCYNVHSVLLQC